MHLSILQYFGLLSVQHPQKKLALTPARKAACCRGQGHVEASSEGEELGTSRRQTVVGVVALAGIAPICGCGEAEAAADAYEIPVNQQCIECVGSGITSCTQPTTSHRPAHTCSVRLTMYIC